MTGPAGTESPRELLANAWEARPYSIAIAVVLIPVGATAIIVGAEVSQALSNITAPYVTRVMGVCFLTGSIMTLVGFARRGATIEALGLAVTALGTGIYGIGVLLGLGLQGIVAGGGYLAITVAALRRVQILLQIADAKAAAPDG